MDTSIDIREFKSGDGLVSRRHAQKSVKSPVIVPESPLDASIIDKSNSRFWGTPSNPLTNTLHTLASQASQFLNIVSNGLTDQPGNPSQKSSQFNKSLHSLTEYQQSSRHSSIETDSHVAIPVAPETYFFDPPPSNWSSPSPIALSDHVTIQSVTPLLHCLTYSTPMVPGPWNQIVTKISPMTPSLYTSNPKPSLTLIKAVQIVHNHAVIVSIEPFPKDADTDMSQQIVSILVEFHTRFASFVGMPIFLLFSKGLDKHVLPKLFKSQMLQFFVSGLIVPSDETLIAFLQTSDLLLSTPICVLTPPAVSSPGPLISTTASTREMTVNEYARHCSIISNSIKSIASWLAHASRTFPNRNTPSSLDVEFDTTPSTKFVEHLVHSNHQSREFYADALTIRTRSLAQSPYPRPSLPDIDDETLPSIDPYTLPLLHFCLWISINSSRHFETLEPILHHPLLLFDFEFLYILGRLFAPNIHQAYLDPSQNVGMIKWFVRALRLHLRMLRTIAPRCIHTIDFLERQILFTEHPIQYPSPWDGFVSLASLENPVQPIQLQVFHRCVLGFIKDTPLWMHLSRHKTHPVIDWKRLQTFESVPIKHVLSRIQNSIVWVASNLEIPRATLIGTTWPLHLRPDQFSFDILFATSMTNLVYLLTPIVWFCIQSQDAPWETLTIRYILPALFKILQLHQLVFCKDQCKLPILPV